MTCEKICLRMFLFLDNSALILHNKMGGIVKFSLQLNIQGPNSLYVIMGANYKTPFRILFTLQRCVVSRCSQSLLKVFPAPQIKFFCGAVTKRLLYFSGS